MPVPMQQVHIKCGYAGLDARHWRKVGARLGRQGQNVIELVLALLQQAILVHAAQQRLALKQPLGLLVVQRQQRPRRLQGTRGMSESATEHHQHR